MRWRRSPEDRRADLYGRRSSDRKLTRILRDIVLTTAVALCFFAFANASDAGDKAVSALNKVQIGRQNNSAIMCAVVSAISLAGRDTIASAGTQNTPLTRSLEHLGYPPFKTRVRQAEKAADAYVRSISARVENAIGHKGDHLVNPGGTINCKELDALSAVRIRVR